MSIARAFSGMARSGLLGVLPALVLLAVSMSSAARAQQRPLDVPYVPTPEHIVEAMLRLAKPTASDFLVDLGCGDGRIPITAALKYGVRGFGVDLNPVRVKEAVANAEKAKVSHMVTFVEGDLFKTDFMKASVLTLYLLPSVNMRIRPQVLEMKPGTRVVSHAFHFEDWEADASEQLDFRSVYFWVVPAKVAGRWSGTAGSSKLELELVQKFQMLSGTATIDGRPSPIGKARMTGEAITLEIDAGNGQTRTLTGRLEGSELKGDGWSARRG